MDGHPVSDVVDPSDITKTRAKINCLSCHQPHSSARARSVDQGSDQQPAFCSTLPQRSDEEVTHETKELENVGT